MPVVDVNVATSLMYDLSAACAIVLLTTTGMRISELVALQAGIDELTGLPLCVEVRKSPTGLNELFLLRSLLSKTEDTLREEQWILAMRPVGSNEIPLPIHALLVLNRLYQPIREITGSKLLFTPSLTGKRGYVTTEPVSNRNSEIRKYAIAPRIRKFIQRWVDLSNLPNDSIHKVADNDLVEYRNSKGACIFPHQLRKTYANFVLERISF